MRWNKENAPLLKPLVITLVTVMLCFAFYFYPGLRYNIGLPYGKLKEDVYRNNTDIDPDAWELITAKTDKVAAFVLYNAQTDRIKYDVYIKKGFGHIGFHFIEGGSISEVSAVNQVTVSYGGEEYVIAFGAKNESGSAKGAYGIEIVSDKPFIMIIPGKTKVGGM
ncbi:MAG: hypothetical protein GX061_02480 [Eubacteriaceae bacterium]|nr:hypothetical protein [Eubacteriaceae bacterium]